MIALLTLCFSIFAKSNKANFLLTLHVHHRLARCCALHSHLGAWVKLKKTANTESYIQRKYPLPTSTITRAERKGVGGFSELSPIFPMIA